MTCSQISTNKHRDGMGYASSKIEQRNTDGNRNVLFSSMEDACSLQETRALSPRKKSDKRGYTGQEVESSFCLTTGSCLRGEMP